MASRLALDWHALTEVERLATRELPHRIPPPPLARDILLGRVEKARSVLPLQSNLQIQNVVQNDSGECLME